MVTISTSMIGRGTDIKVQQQEEGQSKDKTKNESKGLSVLLTYFPKARDLKQILGRSGRYGEKGDTRLVLNKKQLKATLGKTTLTDGFYTNTTRYLQKHQDRMDRKAQRERLIITSLNELYRPLKDAFHLHLIERAPFSNEQEQLRMIWTKMFQKMDEQWKGHWNNIQAQLHEVSLNEAQNKAVDSSWVERVQEELNQFKDKVQPYWDGVHSEVATLLKDQELPKAFSQHREIKTPVLSDKARELLQRDDGLAAQVKVYDRYDPAHDGLAVLYSRRFEKARAVFRFERNPFADYLAWYRGAGILFPNLRAVWRKDMTFLQFLGGGYVAPVQEKPVVDVESDDEDISFSSDALDESDEPEVEESPPIHTDLFKSSEENNKQSDVPTDEPTDEFKNQ